jgi:para-aminobenzoate synthetase component 1
MDWDLLPGGEPHAWWGFYDTFVAIDHDTGTATVASWGLEDPGARPDPVLAARRVQELARCIGEAEPRPADAEPPGLQPAISPGEYEDAVQAVLQDIRDGQYYQACLTYPMTAKRRGQTALDLFTTLRRLTPAPFAAFLATGTPLALAGASPERFLEVRSGLVRARPMKGTRPRGHDLITDQALSSQLRQSEKDRAENVMIVDLMRNDLGRVCELGSIRVPALFTVETYATVHQLTSTVVGRLRPDVPPWEVARACFPPGSMTGAPKIRAMERLAELEPHSRSWYSGVLGYIDVRGEMDLSVVIRTALVRENEVHWHVGGGIVADSTPEGEWGESLDKCPGVLRGQ